MLIRSIFLALDRKYAIGSNDIPSIWDMGLSLFKKNIISVSPIKERTLDSLKEMIKRERNGESIDRSCIRSLLRMYISLGLYSTDFEIQFLDATEMFYKAESEDLILNADPSSYLAKIEERLLEEDQRVDHYLDESTRSTLIKLVERILILDQIDTILSTSLEPLLKEHKKDDIKRLYTLVLRVEESVRLKKAWNNFIKTQGTEMVNDVSKDATLIDDLLSFKYKLSEILEYCFHANDEFAYALKEAFETFINTRQNAPPELLAKYVDEKLRNVSKSGVSDVQLDKMLDDVMQIFRYINGKDVFEAFFKKDLAKRILLKKNASIDAEKSMISRLKTECGSQFTQKIEGMFKDVDLSKEFTSEFKESDELSDVDIKMDMDINILTTSFWPSFQPIEVKLPEDMATIQNAFTKFYSRKHHNRNLVWLHNFGLCTVRSTFKTGRKELTASVFQTIILTLFNDASKLSYEEIKQSSGIGDENELKQTLVSLTQGKFRVLLKENKTKGISNDDQFTVNEAFKSNKVRIVLNKIQMKETQQEQEKVKEGVFVDRQYQVDAAIVRIMKTRKTLTHTELLTELYQQLKFPCQVCNVKSQSLNVLLTLDVKASDLKKRIEILIEREYLKRGQDDASVYHYIS